MSNNPLMCRFEETDGRWKLYRRFRDVVTGQFTEWEAIELPSRANNVLNNICVDVYMVAHGTKPKYKELWGVAGLRFHFLKWTVIAAMVLLWLIVIGANV